MELGFNLRPGINYCAPSVRLGFRGMASGTARLIPLSDPGEYVRETLLFFGVDVPAGLLPYIPEMGPGSEFMEKGFWHHYPITRGVFAFHLIPNGRVFDLHHTLQVVAFAGEPAPRVFLDRRQALFEQQVLTADDLRRIDEILRSKGISITRHVPLFTS